MTPDVLVVGAGAIGLSVAWRAAQRGLAVAVADPTPGRGASHVAAGMLAPVTEVHYGETALLDLALASAERWPAFAADLEEAAGLDVGYRRTGSLLVARDADDNAVLSELWEYQRKLGLDAERLRGRECRELEPMLAPGVRGGILVAGDHAVDSRKLVAALLGACERAGVGLYRAGVQAVVTNRQRVTGARLDDGTTLTAGQVVVAAGCWSGGIGGLPPEAVPPVRPVKGQLVHLRGPAEPPLARRTVRGVVRGSSMYLVARGDGRYVLGATAEEQGFDTRVTAEGVYTLLRDASEILPGVLELELTETVAGLRPGTPDNAPLLGPGALDGLVVATGHHRNGILLTPVSADTVTDLLTTGETPDLIAAFAPGRFAAPAEAVR